MYKVKFEVLSQADIEAESEDEALEIASKCELSDIVNGDIAILEDLITINWHSIFDFSIQS